LAASRSGLAATTSISTIARLVVTIFEKALVAHLVGDWLFQNDWMAQHKSDLRHPAAWVHAAIHCLLQGLVLGWVGGLVLGLAHILVDTRIPLTAWATLIRQTKEGPLQGHLQIWADQVIHIACIALWLQAVPLLPA
jgi:hypothetical protein